MFKNTKKIPKKLKKIQKIQKYAYMERMINRDGVTYNLLCQLPFLSASPGGMTITLELGTICRIISCCHLPIDSGRGAPRWTSSTKLGDRLRPNSTNGLCMMRWEVWGIWHWRASRVPCSMKPGPESAILMLTQAPCQVIPLPGKC